MEPVINTGRIVRRFSRASGSYDQAAEAQQQVCRRAAELLATHTAGTRFPRILELGCGTGGFTRYLHRLYPEAAFCLNDLCESSLRQAASLLGGQADVRVGDAESLMWAGHYPLVASTSAVQWFRSPERWVRAMASLQLPGDVLFFTTFLPGTFREIRSLTGKGLAYPAGSDWREWLAGYRLEVFEAEEIVLSFDSPLEVLRHLKRTGVSATAGNEFWTRSRLADFSARYQSLFARSDGKVTLTYRPLYVLGRKRNTF